MMTKSVYISPSVQEANIGAGNYGTEEKRMNQVADVVARELARHNVIVYRNRPEMTLAQVVADSNSKNPTIHFAIHSNAGGGRGTEVFCFKFGSQGEVMARNVYKYLEALTPVSDRGVKQGFNFYGPGKHMYEVANTTAPAALAEVDFHDHAVGASWIVENIEAIGVAITKGLLDTLSIAWNNAQQPQGTPIIGPATATVGQAQEWAKANDAPQEFIDLAPLYWQLGPKQGGINPALAYVQFAHETGWLYKNGSAAGLDASYKNPCGLKVTQGGGDYEASAHKKFNSWEEGITAQLDHLALYAGAPGYPKADSPDPRHFPYIAGKAPTVEALGGKWAPSTEYGNKLVTMLKALAATAAPIAQDPVKPSDEVQRLKDRIKTLEADLDKSNSKLVVAERAAAEEKAKYERYTKVFKDLKNILGGIE